jgi:hypothetical protein
MMRAIMIATPSAAHRPFRRIFDGQPPGRE